MTNTTGRSGEAPVRKGDRLIGRVGVCELTNMWTSRVAGEDDSVLGKPPIESRQSGTNAIHAFGKQSVW